MTEAVRHSSALALDRLPSDALDIPELDEDPAGRLAAAFLVGSVATRDRPT